VGRSLFYFFVCIFSNVVPKEARYLREVKKTQGPDLTHAGAQRSGSDRDSTKTPQKHPFNLPADQW
jgi:hypothetical protein